MTVRVCDICDIAECYTHDPARDQAFIEGLAEKIWDEMAVGDLEEAAIYAQAALTYMQRHVRPLVEAKEALNGAEKVMGDLKGNINEYWNIRGALTRINAVLEKE
jgi:hypothetical protein